MGQRSELTSSINLEGITLQHVGELVFNYEPTRRVRRNHPANYIRALEDFVVAVLFAERLASTTKLPAVGTTQTDADPPGTRVLAALGNLVEELNVPNNGEIAQSLSQLEDFSSGICADIALVRSSALKDPQAWEGYFARESVYLGNHESLADPTLDPRKYVFGQSHYIPDPLLCAAVPNAFVDEMAGVVEASAVPRQIGFGHNRISRPAIRAFVRASTASHVAFMHAYDAATVVRDQPPLRVPFATRVSLIEARSPVSISGAGARIGYAELRSPSTWLQDLREVLGPTALGAVMSRLNVKRRSFLEGLLGLRDESIFKELRQYLAPLFLSLSRGDQLPVRSEDVKDLRSLVLELRRSTLAPEEPLQVKVFGVVINSLPPSIAELLQGSSDRRYKGVVLARNLRQANTLDDQGVYRARLGRIFRELGEQASSEEDA